MDRELKDYLDRLERRLDVRFEENRQHLERHVDARFEESQGQLAEFRRDVDQRFERQDAQFERTRQHLERHDVRFEEGQAQLAEFRHEADQRFECLEDKIRQTQVTVEDVRGLVQTVAEGVVAVGERQERNIEELKEEIGEVRDLVTTSYRYLDRRLPVSEGRA